MGTAHSRVRLTLKSTKISLRLHERFNVNVCKQDAWRNERRAVSDELRVAIAGQALACIRASSAAITGVTHSRRQSLIPGLRRLNLTGRKFCVRSWGGVEQP